MPQKLSDADQAAADKAEAERPAAEDQAVDRPIGTRDAPSKATTKARLAKIGVEVLAEAKVAEGLICRVLQDAKRVWKEFFHEA